MRAQPRLPVFSPRLARHRLLEKALRKFSPTNCGKSSNYVFNHAFTFMEIDQDLPPPARKPIRLKQVALPAKRTVEKAKTPTPRHHTPDFPRRVNMDGECSEIEVRAKEFPLLSIKTGRSLTPDSWLTPKSDTKKWTFTPTSRVESHMTVESIPTISTADNTMIEDHRRDGGESSEATSPVMEPRYEPRSFSQMRYVYEARKDRSPRVDEVVSLCEGFSDRRLSITYC